jgi:uncharacterized protein YgfB (UPF0149 family)
VHLSSRLYQPDGNTRPFVVDTARKPTRESYYYPELEQFIAGVGKWTRSLQNMFGEMEEIIED